MEEMESLLVLCTYTARLLLALSDRRSLFPWVPEVTPPLVQPSSLPASH
jgi:hypothetical protein